MEMDSDSDDEPPVLVQVGNDDDDETRSENVHQRTEATSDNGAKVHNKKCPVTILSGFLGAGKTSLIQYILQSPHHLKRIAVIENEYGEGLAIESLIARNVVNSSDKNNNNSKLTDLVELPNGCLCCTVKDSLVTTLEALLERQQGLLDCILIECSGMANPGPIASVFWLDEALESQLQLNGIVTVCDASHLLQQLRETTEAAQQIAYADVILLNKVDLLLQPQQQPNRNGESSKDNGDVDSLQKLMQTIRQFHPSAPIRHTSFASTSGAQRPHHERNQALSSSSSFEDNNDLVLDWIVGDKIQQQLDSNTNPLSQLSFQKVSRHHHHHDDDEDCDICKTDNHHHQHTSNISTVSLVQSGSVDRQLLDRWLASILWPHQDEHDQVLRNWLEQQQAGAETELRQHHPTASVPSEQQFIFRIKGVVSVVHTSDDSPDFFLDTGQQKSIRVIARDDEEENGGGTTAAHLDRRRFIVQGVHDLWEVYPAATASDWHDNEEEERCCKLVVIGRFLNQPQLQQGFQACFVSITDAEQDTNHQ